MNVLPFLFDHAAVTNGWRSGKDYTTIFTEKPTIVTQVIASRNIVTHGDTVESEWCEGWIVETSEGYD
jgi:hypothetical protein